MSHFKEIVAAVRAQTDYVPQIGLVLGSGLGQIAELMDVHCCISFADLPHFPCSTVAGHTGSFLFGTLNGVTVVVQQGRVHYYEGCSMQQVVLPVRLMRLLGAKAVILTNAAGGIRREFMPGDLMLLRDHISTFVPSPLRGENDDALGTRFPDMSEVYDHALCDCIRAVAKENSIGLREGVYVQAPGPQYETPAEIRMFSALGADAVGMSTACEAAAAVHCGLRVCGISCITNAAAGILPQPLSHEEVQSAAAMALPKLEVLLTQAVKEISKILS